MTFSRHFGEYFRRLTDVLLNTELLAKINNHIFTPTAHEGVDQNGDYLATLDALQTVIRTFFQRLNTTPTPPALAHYHQAIVDWAKQTYRESQRVAFLLRELKKSVITLVIDTFLCNPSLLSTAFTTELVRQHADAIRVIGESTRNLFTRSCEGYIIHLQTHLKPDIDAVLATPLPSCAAGEDHCSRHTFRPETYARLVAILQNNILPIRRLLPETVVTELNALWGLEDFYEDDYMTYNTMVRTLEMYTGNYYALLRASLRKAREMADELQRLNDELRVAQGELAQKTAHNERLNEQVEDLRDQNGMTFWEFLKECKTENTTPAPAFSPALSPPGSPSGTPRADASLSGVAEKGHHHSARKRPTSLCLLNSSAGSKPAETSLGKIHIVPSKKRKDSEKHKGESPRENKKFGLFRSKTRSPEGAKPDEA